MILNLIKWYICFKRKTFNHLETITRFLYYTWPIYEQLYPIYVLIQSTLFYTYYNLIIMATCNTISCHGRFAMQRLYEFFPFPMRSLYGVRLTDTCLRNYVGQCSQYVEIGERIPIIYIYIYIYILLTPQIHQQTQCWLQNWICLLLCYSVSILLDTFWPCGIIRNNHGNFGK